ncbi:hypothetical protein [Herbinix luporum]|uniref:Uncharacterized protein n=1 Tax=Herbinix luporum TaxID=1679721 RepID=A0A0K8J7E1_9FIRM|nr:hypothetical protein [Herbinix luporum]CUH93581.1 hypothetical protein SD1D_2045 [Herbinix luporum]
MSFLYITAFYFTTSQKFIGAEKASSKPKKKKKKKKKPATEENATNTEAKTDTAAEDKDKIVTKNETEEEK